MVLKDFKTLRFIDVFASQKIHAQIFRGKTQTITVIVQTMQNEMHAIFSMSKN